MSPGTTVMGTCQWDPAIPKHWDPTGIASSPAPGDAEGSGVTAVAASARVVLPASSLAQPLHHPSPGDNRELGDAED